MAFSCYLHYFSEKTDTTVERANATNEDISNANNNMQSASSPIEEKDPENKSTGNNNNWWGSWINSAKSKVNFTSQTFASPRLENIQTFAY